MSEYLDEETPTGRARALQALMDEITELAGHLNAAQHRWLMLIAEFDRRQGWADGSSQSCAHWLNWKCGLNLGAAREKVRVAHALQELPKVAEAMARGELSYSKVRALTRVACPATEDAFLMIALHASAHQVESLVRHYRHAQEAELLSREAQQQASRGLSHTYDEDGSIVIKARLPAEVGVLVLKALEQAVRELPSGPDVNPEVTESMRRLGNSSPAQRADALGLIAESFLQHGAQSMSGVNRHHIVVHVDARLLHGGTAGADAHASGEVAKNGTPGAVIADDGIGRAREVHHRCNIGHANADLCEIEHGPALAAETARRLACDASIVAIVENAAGEPLNVGRRTRSIPPALRRALKSRDRGCRFPGCSHERYVDAHHIRHWAHGGETNMSNLVCLCRFHHRQVHEGRVVIQRMDDGALRFVRPNGESFESIVQERAQPLDWSRLPDRHRSRGIHIDATTATRKGGDARLDHDLALAALCGLAQHARRRAAAAQPNVSAETSGPAVAPVADDVSAETFMAGGDADQQYVRRTWFS